MKPKSNLSRMTIDISQEEHKQFKVMAAFLGKSMRELVVQAVQKQIKENQTILSSMQQEK